MKQCKCGETDLTKFGIAKHRHDGLKRLCKICHNAENRRLRTLNPEIHRKSNLAYARSEHGRALQRANNLRRKYWPKLTNEQATAEYNRLLTEQNYCCALCDKPQSKMDQAFDVDHCKVTGTVRGLLCNPCNRVVVQDKTVETIKKLFAYFNKYHTI